MNQLRIQFESSDETSSHQVRIYIDEEDYLKNEYLGIDPPHFFKQSSLLEGGTVLIGRCNCGVVGCGDLLVEVTFDATMVHWQVKNKTKLSFDRNEYICCVSEASQFKGWESLERTAERLVDLIFLGSELRTGHKFKWASARIEKGTIKLSFEDEGDQLLHSFKWDSENPSSAELEAETVYKRLFQ